MAHLIRRLMAVHKTYITLQGRAAQRYWNTERTPVRTKLRDNHWQYSDIYEYQQRNQP